MGSLPVVTPTEWVWSCETSHGGRLSRSAREASRRDRGGGDPTAYTETCLRWIAGSEEPVVAGGVYRDQKPNDPDHCHTLTPILSQGKGRGASDVRQVRAGWRVRWGRVSRPGARESVDEDPEVEWEVVVRSRVLASVLSSVVVGGFVS